MFPSENFFSGGDADGADIGTSGFVTFNNQSTYCKGGNADGFSYDNSGNITINYQQFYSGGGNYDGSAMNDFNGYFYDPLMVFDGDDGDGWSCGGYDGYVYPLMFTLGGWKDGAAIVSSGMISVNNQYYYCRSSIGDGYSWGLYSGGLMPYIYCRGGNGDGFITTSSGIESLGYGIWTGYINSDWGLAGNWKHNTIPTSSMNVLIPGGAPYHPVLLDPLAILTGSGTYFCRRLDIYPGGMLSVHSHLRVNGILNVEGMLNFEESEINIFTILANGKLSILNGGEVNIQHGFQ
jgi:hypothetical protein